VTKNEVVKKDICCLGRIYISKNLRYILGTGEKNIKFFNIEGDLLWERTKEEYSISLYISNNERYIIYGDELFQY